MEGNLITFKEFNNTKKEELYELIAKNQVGKAIEILINSKSIIHPSINNRILRLSSEFYRAKERLRRQAVTDEQYDTLINGIVSNLLELIDVIDNKEFISELNSRAGSEGHILDIDPTSKLMEGNLIAEIRRSVSRNNLDQAFEAMTELAKSVTKTHSTEIYNLNAAFKQLKKDSLLGIKREESIRVAENEIIAETLNILNKIEGIDNHITFKEFDNTKKEELYALIAKNQLEKTIEILINSSSIIHPLINKRILQLSLEFQKARQDQRMQLVTDEQYNVLINRIVSNLLELIDVINSEEFISELNSRAGSEEHILDIDPTSKLIDLLSKNSIEEIENRPELLLNAFQVNTDSDLLKDERFQQRYKQIKGLKLDIESIVESSFGMTQVREILALLHETKSYENPENAQILAEIIKRAYYTSWNEDEKHFYEAVVKIILEWKDFYISYTNKNAAEINSSYQELIRSAFSKLPDIENRSKENYLAKLVIKMLRRQNLESFQDDNSLIIGESIKEKIESFVERSFVFIQLVEDELFIPSSERQVNWCFTEYQQFKENHERLLKEFPYTEHILSSGRFLFIIAEEDLQSVLPALPPSDYRSWIESIKNVQGVYIEPGTSMGAFRQQIAQLGRVIVEFKNRFIESLLSPEISQEAYQREASIRKKNKEIEAQEKFADNLTKKIALQSLELKDIYFFGNTAWELKPQINILLGRNGYGKTHLLRLLLSLLQNNEDVATTYFKRPRTGEASSEVAILKDEEIQVIMYNQASFKSPIGKIPVLAIPDMRLMDKSRGGFRSSSKHTDLREYGAYHFIHQESYELFIENFLNKLGIQFFQNGGNNENAREIFKQLEIFGLLQDVVQELTDSSFEFHRIKDLDNADIEIQVITEGNKNVPLPIQTASRGTLSVLVIFGLIYTYLKSLPLSTEYTPLETPAIVFIDEIDAHLHPIWQQKIITLLRTKFPNIQFIITAHSPLIVAGCKEEEVSVLRKEPDDTFTIYQFVEDFIGWEAEEIYQKVFAIEEKDDSFKHYNALYPFKNDIEKQIEELEQTPTSTEKEDATLKKLYDDLYYADKARNKLKEEIMDEELELENRRLKRQLARLTDD